MNALSTALKIMRLPKRRRGNHKGAGHSIQHHEAAKGGSNQDAGLVTQHYETAQGEKKGGGGQPGRWEQHSALRLPEEGATRALGTALSIMSLPTGGARQPGRALISDNFSHQPYLQGHVTRAA